jgi:DNA/RNA endonuclease YhcR with UshA esterase domain
MNAARNVTATFEPTRMLTVSKVGDGGGLVRSTPQGIDCGPDCSENYAGTSVSNVTLVAEPDNQSFLLFWTSPCSFESLTCNVNVGAALSQTIITHFAANRVFVTVNGPGTVTGTGIACPGDCDQVVNRGSVMTLTATTPAGSVFVGWQGQCDGSTAATCTFNVDRGANVTATFLIGELYVGVQGSGRVVSTPAGIDCRDPECYASFPYGTEVTLQAIPDPGMRFDHWDSDCEGTSPTCTLTLSGDEARSAIATFTAAASRKSDFDGNGKSDLLLRNADGRDAIWLMDGLSIASSAEIFPAGTAWQVAHIADLNGDGKSDLVWQNPDGRITVYLMDGTTATTTQLILPAGGGWTVTQAADLDGDGKADLIFQNADGTIAGWLMNGAAMTAGSTILGPGSGWSVTKTGDFNGDGKADLVWTHTDGRVAIWLMDGLTPISTNQILNGGSGWSVTHTADFDGDGKSDLVWQNVDGSIAIWLMNGNVMASGSGLLNAGTGWSVTRTGDFNGDGKADLFFLHTDGRAAIYLMNGLVPTQTTQILNAGGGWTAKRVQDMNGDGMADIVWENVDGTVAVWLMNGTLMTSGSGIMGAGSGWSVSPVSP